MYCKKCGAKLAENAAFCHKCGEKIIILETHNDSLNEESSNKESTFISLSNECDTNNTVSDDNKLDDHIQKSVSDNVDVGGREEINIEDSRKNEGIEINKLKYPIIPAVISLLFFSLIIVFLILLFNKYEDLELASKNLENNQLLQGEIYRISSEVEKNTASHKEITNRLNGLTESYTSKEVSDIDKMISDLTTLEKNLESEFREISSLYGKEYELFWFIEDGYTLEDRNNAIRDWKKSRQSSNKTYSDLSDQLEADIFQDITEGEADVCLKLALYYCHLNETDFNNTIDTAVSRTENSIKEMNGNICVLWIAVVISFLCFLWCFIITLTYKKRKFKHLSRESYKLICAWTGFVLLIITVASVSGTMQYGNNIEENSQIQHEIEKLDDNARFIDSLDCHPTATVYFAWENATINKIGDVRLVLNRNLQNHGLLLLMSYIIMAILALCVVDCFIKGSITKKSTDNNTNIELPDNTRD